MSSEQDVKKLTKLGKIPHGSEDSNKQIKFLPYLLKNAERNEETKDQKERSEILVSNPF